MLSDRQSRLYVYKVDIWRAPAVSTSPFILVSSAVSCMFTSASEADDPSVIGRTKEAQRVELDRFGFPLGTDVRDTDYLNLVGAPNGSPDVGRWFAVHGNPQVHAYRANRLRVPVKSTLAPYGASS